MYNSHKSQNSSLSSTSFQQLQEESRKRKLEEASRQEVAQMELRRQEQLAQELLRRELAQQELKRHHLAEAELRRLAYSSKFG